MPVMRKCAIAGGFAVHTQSLFMGDAELVVLQAGGDVGMRFGIDIRVDAQADRRRAAEFAGHADSGEPVRFPIRR
jgi:hypothetical protein